MDYTKLTTVLIEAVKELQSENQALKQQIQQNHLSFQQEIETLRQAITELAK